MLGTFCYKNNPQQISTIADTSYSTDGTIVKTGKAQNYSYDANGNLLSVNTTQPAPDGSLRSTNNRRLLWDEESRLLSVSDNGFVSNYWYDASGERILKMSGEGEGVLVNGILSGGRTGTTNYTAYVNPYLVITNGGQMSKHFYIGSQRIISQLCSSGSVSNNPKDIGKATVSVVDYDTKYTNLTSKVKTRFDSLGVAYSGKNNAGVGFWTYSAPVNETDQYYYHPDHLGSSSLITNLGGDLVQHIEYVPFGEVFVEERTSTWGTPYKFNAKELDEETGLYYYGVRYLDPRTSVWLSVDPLAEKFPGVSSYVYCLNNPIKFIDPDGKEIWIAFNVTNQNGRISQEKVQYKNGALYGTDGKLYSGNNEYATKVLGDINQLSKDNSELSDRITTLQDSKEIHTIGMPTNADGTNSSKGTRSKIESHTPTGSKTEYNPDNKKDINGRVRTPRAALAHELLGHGWDNDQGKTDLTKTSNGIEMKEVNAVNIGNIAGAAAGDGKRTTYNGKDIPQNLLKDTHEKN